MVSPIRDLFRDKVFSRPASIDRKGNVNDLEKEKIGCETLERVQRIGVEGVIMDKILVVDSVRKNLDYLRTVSKSTNHFQVVPVTEMDEALEVLKNEEIAVVVIDHLDSLNIDGLELLAHVSRNYPSMPCIVMTSYGKPWFKNKAGRHDAVYILKKPFNNGSLVSAVFVALSLRDENKVSQGATVRSYLPLIEMEQRTCGVTVETRSNGKGFLYFDNGELIDAFYNKTNGEQAAREIVGWNGVRVQFSSLRRRKRFSNLKIDVMALAGAEWKNDGRETSPIEKDAPADPSMGIPFMSEKQLESCIFGDSANMDWGY